MKKMIKGFLLIAMFAVVTACELGAPPPADDAAKQIAQQFFDALHKGDYEQVFALSSEELFLSRGKEEWKTYFKKVEATMGPLQSYNLKEPFVSTRYSGTFYMYEYRSKFENGLGKELITMVHQINSDVPLRVSGYKIESSKLPELH